MTAPAPVKPRPVGKHKGALLDARYATQLERKAKRLSTFATQIEILGANEAADKLVEEAVAYAYEKGLVTLDVETAAKKEWAHIEEAALDPYLGRIVLMQLGDTERQYLIWWETISKFAKQRILGLWCDPAVKKAGVNLKYDSKMLIGNEGFEWRGAGLLDAQLIEQILACGLTGDIGFTIKQTGMGPMMERWWGVELVKDDDVRMAWGELTPGVWHAPGETEEQGRIRKNYAADDCCAPILLLERQIPWIRELDLVRTLKLEMEFLPELAEMECRGMWMNRDEWAVLCREAEEGLAKAEAQLDHLFDVKVTYRTDMNGKVEVTRDKNYGSTDELKDLVHDWMLKNYGVEVIFTNAHFKAALIRAGMNPDRLDRLFVPRMVDNPDKEGSQMKVGYPKMNDYIVGSEHTDALWGSYRGKLPETAFAMTDTESDTFRLMKIIFVHENKDEIDLDLLPTNFGLPTELVEPILAFRDNNTKLSRYAWSWIGDPKIPGDTGLVNPITGRVHTDTTQTAADTGRLTTRPNFQNLPAKQAYRGVFQPRKGYKMIGADFSQIEPRIIGEISQAPTYMRVFWSEMPGTPGFEYWCGDTVTEPLDLYGSVGADIGVLPPDAARKSVAKKPEHSKGRKKSKIAVLGLGYGQQKKKFYISYLLDMGAFFPKSESDALFDGFWSAAQEVQAALDALSEIAWPGGDEFRGKKQTRKKSPRATWHPYVDKRVTWSESLGGRKRFFDITQKDYSYTVGRNHPIQSTGADILKETVIYTNREFRKRGLQAYIILTAHDELLGEVIEYQAEEAKRIMEQVMSKVGQRYCPHVPITADGYIGDFWIKD